MDRPAKQEYESLLELGSNIVVARIHIDKLREQDTNARAMSKEAFDQLTMNIKTKGALESLPYCATTEKGVEIVSGHHRIRAARKAGFPYLHVLIDESGLTKEQIISKQLAHNSISGTDNPELLAKLFAQIQDAALKLEAFIDPSIIQQKLQAIDIPMLEVPFEWHYIMVAFLPNQLEQFDSIYSALRGNEEGMLVADLKHWERFKTITQQIMKTENIKSIGIVLTRMCDIVEAYLEQKAREKR